MIDAINIALSGLRAASEQVRVGANNIVNAGTVGALDAADGPAPYNPQDVVATADPRGGVQTRVVDRKPAYGAGYDPTSPYANSDGLVGVPNVDYAEEAVRLKLAELSYKASLKVIKTAEKMQDALLQSFDQRI
jgi:flagellar basal-body rod protein FlgC